MHLAFANNLQATTSVAANQWMHIVGTYTSGSRKVYADGVLLASDSYSSMNIGATEMTLGANNDDSQAFNGSISNFKIWNVALTADEVAAEYALGRTGKALNVTDTAVCLGGTVPRAQLDVRGSARFDGHLNVSSGNNNGSPVSILNGWKTLTWSGNLVGNGTKSVVIFDRSGRGSSNGNKLPEK